MFLLLQKLKKTFFQFCENMKAGTKHQLYENSSKDLAGIFTGIFETIDGKLSVDSEVIS